MCRREECLAVRKISNWNLNGVSGSGQKPMCGPDNECRVNYGSCKMEGTVVEKGELEKAI